MKAIDSVVEYTAWHGSIFSRDQSGQETLIMYNEDEEVAKELVRELNKFLEQRKYRNEINEKIRTRIHPK